MAEASWRVWPAAAEVAEGREELSRSSGAARDACAISSTTILDSLWWREWRCPDDDDAADI